jgi:2-polyprenyl-3-methyl-5-hydroxy-6-metoxy-1,4-benzoquinol methylase
MTFDYEKQTREHYKNTSVAREYHREFTELGGVDGFRYRWVAQRERQATQALLERIHPRRVLDLPTGTGKMAPVFKALGVQVTAADISQEMLGVAREVYARLGYDRVTFEQCEAEKASRLAADVGFAAVVCIRLMHRVPREVRTAILAEFARTSPNLVISYGVTSLLHKPRRMLRRLLVGGRDVSESEYPTMHECLAELGRFHTIVARRSVIPLLSGEHVFLLVRR